jgi:NAD-dependent deacetylase
MARPLLDRVAEVLKPDVRITVLTGAGVSTASGVPTFRGSGGLWKSFRAEDLATPQAFARNPATVWEWYDWRRGLIASCAPNPAHHVLAAWSLRFPRFTLVTQNVDGLHERAGTARIVRLHGSIWEVGCWRDCGRQPRRWRDDRVPMPSLPPACDICGGPLRPGVVWFGENLDPRDVCVLRDWHFGSCLSGGRPHPGRASAWRDDRRDQSRRHCGVGPGRHRDSSGSRDRVAGDRRTARLARP